MAKRQASVADRALAALWYRGWPAADIGSKMGISKWTVCRRASALGLPRRSKGRPYRTTTKSNMRPRRESCLIPRDRVRGKAYYRIAVGCADGDTGWRAVCTDVPGVTGVGQKSETAIDACLTALEEYVTDCRLRSFPVVEGRVPAPPHASEKWYEIAIVEGARAGPARRT